MTKPANFPGRKNARRQRAIERMEALPEATHMKQLVREAVIWNTHRNIASQSLAHTKKDRTSYGRRS